MKPSREKKLKVVANLMQLKLWFIATGLTLSVLPHGGYAQSALNHYVWEESGTYQPYSRTSISITGPLQLTEEAGKLTIRLAGKGPFHLSSEGIFYREWGVDLSGKKVTAEIFRIDQDPGQLLNGNTICGDKAARFLVFYDEFFYDDHLLELAVFDSEKPPFDIKSEGLCGTFNYSIESLDSHREATNPKPASITPNQTAPVPNGASGAYDILTYCKQVSNASSGSYQIEQTCRDKEKKSQSNIAHMTIPQRIRDYCWQVGQTIGGSYQIMETCINEELKAKADLN